MSYYVIYKDAANQWRWQYVASNYKIIAVSSESYWNKADCLNSINLMKNSYSSQIIER